ncbi:DUF3488 and transglutaminase-like domain-containing protein [Thauera sp.]|uniref:transglutaminase TgpA family protein n=1 Tax=Thauera sp. TaxID=1905334 RepID=UPI002D1C5B17|nr:DUF3488 and transglutaminase-like domain-containing protein [Thauera sp.]HRP22659.1 DUF3488 and transglutaminase-like domain-containing protein [Thauera sp.]
MIARLWRMRPRLPGASPRPAAASAALDRRQGAWLLAAAALTLAPHGLWLPAWIAVLGAALLGWRAVLLWRGHRPPPHLVLLVLAIAAGVGVRLEFGHFFGKAPGVALLALLLGLKLLETRAARDIRAGVLLCLFLQLAVFLEDQSLPIAALALGGTLLALAALVALADPRGGHREPLRTAAVVLAQGLPFMLLLFLLFPRIQGPLWGLPADAYSARTGLSDTMAPGSISELSNSSAIVLRAAFSGPPPPPAQRYWRGPVLTQFDGRTWRALPFAEAAAPFYTAAGPALDYQLTLEPHNRRWLLALDYPGASAPAIRYASDYHALAAQPVRNRSRYALTAHPEAAVGESESSAVLAASLRLPADSNPRTRALAQQLAAGTDSHAEILRRVIAHLRDARLRYTLRPPLLGRHAADEFLFDTQRGFCEHFASAFAVLMRAAGVPTRIVTGYQGGEINPIDAHLVVRQSDAHAWAEVWLEEKGWIRVDPTALTAPQRIDDGLAAALSEFEGLPLMRRADMAWLRDLRHQWEALSNAWNQRVLGYNPERQRELLARLGLKRVDAATMAGVLSIASALLFAGLYLWASRPRVRHDPLQRQWDRFSARLAKVGLAREPWEGPLAYGERIAAARPEQAAELRAISASYARLRYGPGTATDELQVLRKRIDALKLS